MRVNVDGIVAEGDEVIVRFTGTATHKGPIFGAPATNRQITFHGIDWMQFGGGKVAEVWHPCDDAVVLMSLGARLPRLGT